MPDEPRDKDERQMTDLSPEVIFPDVTPPLPYGDKFRRASDKKILELWFKFAPECDNHKQLLSRVSVACDLAEGIVEGVIRKAEGRRLAKEQREVITKKIYEDKVPLLQSIVGMSLEKIEEFIQGMPIFSLEGAAEMVSIITSLNTMLRLETGKSTENKAEHIKVVVTQKNYEDLIAELRQNDPFKDYGKPR